MLWIYFQKYAGSAGYLYLDWCPLPCEVGGLYFPLHIIQTEKLPMGFSQNSVKHPPMHGEEQNLFRTSLFVLHLLKTFQNNPSWNVVFPT